MADNPPDESAMDFDRLGGYANLREPGEQERAELPQASAVYIVGLEKLVRSMGDKITQRDTELADTEHLARFLAETWDKINEWAIDHMDESNLGTLPMIQGIQNQLSLKDLGEQTHDTKAVARAINRLLSPTPDASTDEGA